MSLVLEPHWQFAAGLVCLLIVSIVAETAKLITTEGGLTTAGEHSTISEFLSTGKSSGVQPTRRSSSFRADRFRPTGTELNFITH